MTLHGTAKLCGWCRRQARRSIAANHPNLAAAPDWDQKEFNRLARYEEIAMVANGLGGPFPAEEFQLNTVWVHQTNRYLDYPQLEVFNFFS